MNSRELLAVDGWWGCDPSWVAHVPVDNPLLMHTRAVTHWTQWVMKRERKGILSWGGYGGPCLGVIGMVNRSGYDQNALYTCRKLKK